MASASAASATVAAPTATTATFALRAGLIHDQRPAEEFLTVESRDGFFGFRVVLNLREAKSTRLTGEAIAKQSERIGLYASFRKQRLHFLFRSFER
jgi:hypothetical protein